MALSKNPAAAGNKSSKASPAEQVAVYLAGRHHPLQAEIEALCTIIKSAHPRLSERIKWNAPSYHVDGVDLLTFHLRSHEQIMLVFHHAAIVQVASDLLKGNYADRRLAHFHTMADIDAQQAELQRILHAYVGLIETPKS